MGRAGRGGGGFGRGGGISRGGGGLRSGGMGRNIGGGGRAGRGSGLGAPRVTPPRAPMPRPAPAPRRGIGGAAGFGLGLGTGLAMGGRRRRMWGMGPGWGFGRRRMMGTAGMGHGGGCSSILMVIVVLIILMSVISLINNWGPGGGEAPAHIAQITPSTRVREPLPRGSANEMGGLFTDNLGWIGNPTLMEAGLRNFFQATGVRPHVYITDMINETTNPTEEEFQEFASNLYDSMFHDEGHLLLIFMEGDRPTRPLLYVQPGVEARRVMDDEAISILLDYVEFYNSLFFTTLDVSEEQIFSNAFNAAAQRIMFRPRDNRPIWITVIIVTGVVLVVLIAFNFWKKRQIQKNLEAEQTERILSQDLGTFGDDEASRLARQYEEE